MVLFSLHGTSGRRCDFFLEFRIDCSCLVLKGTVVQILYLFVGLREGLSLEVPITGKEIILNAIVSVSYLWRTRGILAIFNCRLEILPCF